MAALALAQSAEAWAGGRSKANPDKDASKTVPWVQLKLDALGFPGMPANFLSAGASMLTVHFVDSGHMLVTFGTRGLLQRLEGDPPEDEDRLIAAELVDLPTGKIEARTEWRVHDHGRYLWNLGGGRFLLRIGGSLSTIEPLAHLAAGEAFQRTVFPGRQGAPSVVQVSADGGVVTVERLIATGPKPTTVVLGDQDSATAGTVQTTKALIDFFRLERDAEGTTVVRQAGAVQAPELMYLPVDADGYLWATQTDNNRWSVTFDEFGGKTIELGKIDSSCQPRLQMLDRSEFLAMTCHGGDDHIKMASYGLDGQETWEENVGDFGVPTFAFAAEAARFAVSHITEADLPPVVNQGPNGAEASSHQEVRVYQVASGDLLLRTECIPVFKTAENFDLSADGTLAAVVRNGAIAVYKLRPLGPHDRDDMAEVAKFAPPASSGAVHLTRLLAPVRPAETAAESDVSVAKGMVAPAAQGAVTTVPSARRRPPTLLKPGEKPEFGKANAPEDTPAPK
jgi:hypothetical protein